MYGAVCMLAPRFVAHLPVAPSVPRCDNVGGGKQKLLKWGMQKEI